MSRSKPKPFVGKPRYTKAQKAENAWLVEREWDRIERHISSACVDSSTHITLRFANGRRLELYNTVLGLHNPSRWLRYYDFTNLVRKIRDFAKLPPEQKGDAEVFEVFE